MAIDGMINVSGLEKSYGPTKALHGISFNVKKGEVVGFLGPNGAGKSTTMKIITGSMAPSAGEVRVAGFDVFEDPVEVKRRIGYLPEIPPVYGEMDVESFLTFVAKLKGVQRSNVRAQVQKAIEKTDLGVVRKRLIQNLSKGYKQRVGIAQALVSDPEVLILDEPTSGLDPRQVAEVRSLIRELRGEHTIILSTHILPEVQAMCERIIIINKGTIVAQDSLSGLTSRMAGGVEVKIKLSRPSSQAEEAFKRISGVSGLSKTSAGYSLSLQIDKSLGESAYDLAIEHIAEAAVVSKAGLLELRREDANLEDVFLKLTTNDEGQSFSNSHPVQSSKELGGTP